MLYKKHKYPYGFVAIELAVKLQDLLDPDHASGHPYQYSSEALEVVDEIVRKKLMTQQGIRNHMTKMLSAMFDCDYQPDQLDDIATLVSSRLGDIKAYS